MNVFSKDFLIRNKFPTKFSDDRGEPDETMSHLGLVKHNISIDSIAVNA